MVTVSLGELARTNHPKYIKYVMLLELVESTGMCLERFIFVTLLIVGVPLAAIGV
jgi:hypothetical protein